MADFPTTPVDNPQTKTEILAELNKAFDHLANIALAMEQDAYDTPPHEDKWSASGHHEHIMLSNAASATALKQAPAFFAAFKLDRPAGNYADVVAVYQKRAQQTVLKPSAKYAPTPGAPKSREELLTSWKMVQSKIQERLENWSDEDLDNAVLPHPATGLMTMKELLLFTIYHTYHHAYGMEKAAKGEYTLVE